MCALEPAQHRVPLDDEYLDEIAEGFGQIIDAKSPFTAGHSARVGLYTDLIAEQLGITRRTTPLVAARCAAA